MSELIDQTNYYQDMADRGEIKQHQVKALEKAHEGKPLAQLHGDPQPILERLNAGESAVSIAKSFEIHHTALYAWLLRHCPEEWQAISAARQLARLDDCEEVWDDNAYSEDGEKIAVDNVTVSRTREKMKQAQWHLERANRKLFGNQPQQGIEIDLPGEINIKFVSQ